MFKYCWMIEKRNYLLCVGKSGKELIDVSFISEIALKFDTPQEAKRFLDKNMLDGYFVSEHGFWED